jgi:2-polyprenyl-3-methyl-5-hydroxy-6-metoxy-1,4-benzoquinol methylase
MIGSRSGGMRTRQRQPEWMDEPGLEPALHRQALSGLSRINAISRAGSCLLPVINQLTAARSSTSPLQVLDVACGGGDVARRLVVAAGRRRIPMEVTGIDLSPEAIGIAHSGAQATRFAPQLRFIVADALHGDWPPPATGQPRYDVVVSSLFLHHLDEDAAVGVLERMRQAAQWGVVVDDLLRSSLAWWVAWLGVRLLSRSPVVHQDGPLSVQGAFTVQEAKQMAAAAGWQSIRIRRRFPFRWLLSESVKS